MIEALKQRINADAALLWRGRYLTTSFLLEVGATAWLMAIFEGSDHVRVGREVGPLARVRYRTDNPVRPALA